LHVVATRNTASSHARTNPLQYNRSRGGYPQIDISGVTIKSSSIDDTASIIRLVFPVISPTTGFSWSKPICIDTYSTNATRARQKDGLAVHTLVRRNQKGKEFGVNRRLRLRFLWNQSLVVL